MVVTMMKSWKKLIKIYKKKQALETALEAAGKLDAIQFTPSGPAGIFGMYAQPGANLGVVFANEFFVVSLI